MKFSKIELFDIANGEGIRVSLFVSGCNFHCKGCFNECTWGFDYGSDFTEETENLILNRLKHPDFAGLSILGGDPLWQDEDGIKKLIKLCNDVHSIGKTVWIWSGFTWEEIWGSEDNFLRKVLIKNCDIFVDGRFVLEKKDTSLPWRGSSNQRVINVQKSTEHNVVLVED